MSDVFEMPEVGEGVVEVEIASWKVAVGDVVARDQVLCEVTTDKASLEITSPRAGTVAVLGLRFQWMAGLAPAGRGFPAVSRRGSMGASRADPVNPLPSHFLAQAILSTLGRSAI